MSSVKLRTIKVHLYDILVALLIIGRKATSEDLANHLYNEQWADADKYAILAAVQKVLDEQMELQEGPRHEDPYGLRKDPRFNLYWLAYNVGESL